MAMSRSLGANSFTTRPSIRMSPALTGSSPAMLRSVDFPQPEGPSSTMNSRSSAWTLTLERAVRLPNFFETFLTSSDAMTFSPLPNRTSVRG